MTGQKEIDYLKENCSPELARLITDTKKNCETAARDTAGLPGAGDGDGDTSSKADCTVVKAMVRVSFVCAGIIGILRQLSVGHSSMERVLNIAITDTGNL